MTRKSTKLSLMVITITFFFLLGMVSSAKALTIDASALSSSWTLEMDYWIGNETSQADINVVINPIIGSALELYKIEQDGTQEGPLTNAYSTDMIDGSNWDIVWVGPSYISPPSYLLVKDGNADPAWYLFNLSLIWDGMETIELRNFWPSRGDAISHATLYGNVSVPEPSTILLLGAGLLGMGVLGRNFRGKP